MKLHCNRCELLLTLVDTREEPPRPLTEDEFVAEFTADMLGCPYCPGALEPALPLGSVTR